MPIRFAAIAVFLLAAATAGAATPTYAPVKERICGDCPMPKPGIKLPRHAVVAGSWGFFSQGSNFEVLDLDSGKLVRAFVPTPAVPKHRALRATRETIKLPSAALPELVELANRIWADPQRIRSRDATDISWDLWLIDGQQVRHEAGFGLPTGLAAEWMRRINKLQGLDSPSLEAAP
jgi:hypothetical protein